MKILIVSPQYNGLMKYSNPLYELIKENSINDEIFYDGFSSINFNIEEINKNLNFITEKIIKLNPDIIHYNYGTYDAEQLIPYFLDKKGFNCKSYLTYHSLQFDLFKKINIEEYDKYSNEYVSKMDGYVFFTEYGKSIFTEKYGMPLNSVVSYHPKTHNINLDEKTKKEYDLKYGIDRDKKYACTLGYASHWKDSSFIIKLCENFKNINFIVAGPYWLQKIKKENPNLDIEKISNLKIIDEELLGDDFNYFLNLGIGIFPYCYFKSFQGSGLLPNYLGNGLPYIANSIKPFEEYCKGSKYCFDFNDEKLLFKMFKERLNDSSNVVDEEFTYENHAKKILKLWR